MTDQDFNTLLKSIVKKDSKKMSTSTPQKPEKYPQETHKLHRILCIFKIKRQSTYGKNIQLKNLLQHKNANNIFTVD